MGKKKGINIGMEFVVVIVIAVLILTLGTGFIRNLFKNINTIGITVTEDAIKQLSEQLKKDPNERCVLTTGDEAIAKRDVENTFKVLVNNKDPQAGCYKLTFSASGTRPLTEAVGWIDTFQTVWIGGGEVTDIPVLMRIPVDSPTGKFLFQFQTGKLRSDQVPDSASCSRINGTAVNPPSDYCTKRFFLNIE